MPVTSLENQIRGTKIWALPKTIAAITIEVIGDNIVTRIGDQLKLTTPLIGQRREVVEQQMDLYTRGASGLQESRTVFRGAFERTDDWQALLNRSSGPERLQYGTEGEIAKLLNELQVSHQSFRTQFSRSVDSILALPSAVVQ